MGRWTAGCVDEILCRMDEKSATGRVGGGPSSPQHEYVSRKYVYGYEVYGWSG